MTVSIDHSDDWQVWDGLETVTYASTRTATGAGGNAYAIVTAAALRADTQQSETEPSGGRYAKGRLVWDLPASYLPGIECKPGDTLTDARNDTWTVLESRWQVQGTIYRLETINLAVAYDLRELVSITRPTNTQDAAGGRVPTFAAVYSGVQARIQETTADVTDGMGRRQARRTYQVFIGSRPTLLIEDRLVDSAGVVYEITGWHAPDRIDQLMTLDCERLGP